MVNIVRKGQTVYAADGTHLGGVLQCDSRFMIIGRSRWTADHVVIPVEEVAASGPDVVVLSSLPDAILPETAEPWSPPPDPSGNANGVDIEPLRAGMAEIEDRSAGISAVSRTHSVGAPARTGERDRLLPTEEDAWELERERIAQVDAEIDRCLAEEIEDFELGAGCRRPGPEETALTGGEREDLDRPAHPPPVEPLQREEARPAATGPALAATRAALRATRSARALQRSLRKAGFSRAEAHAIATGGYHALVSLVESLRPTGTSDRAES